MGPLAALVPVVLSSVIPGLAGAGAAAGALGVGAGAAGTAAGLASTLGVIGTDLGIAGALYGGISANNAAKYQAKVANYNAGIQDRNAQNALIAGSQKESKLKMLIARTIGEQKAAEAANGVDVNVGSSLDIADSTKLEGAADIATTHYQALQEAYGYGNQAWSDRANAKLEKASGRNALAASLFDAGSTVMGGASGLSKKWDAYKKVGIGA